MQFRTTEITLKDGMPALLRSPRVEDAAEMIDYLKTSSGETHFLLRAPEECIMTMEQEVSFLQNVIDSEDTVMIVCEVEGKIAGSCQISFENRIRTGHRAMIAVALLKEFWGLGIGTQMLEALIAIARDRGGILQLELEVIEGNERAIGLYEKMGFSIVAEKPNAIRLEDGTLLKEYYMIKPL